MVTEFSLFMLAHILLAHSLKTCIITSNIHTQLALRIRTIIFWHKLSADKISLMLNLNLLWPFTFIFDSPSSLWLWRASFATVALPSSMYSTNAISFFVGIRRTSYKFGYLRKGNQATRCTMQFKCLLREKHRELVFRNCFWKVLKEENFVWRKILVWHLDCRAFRAKGRNSATSWRKWIRQCMLDVENDNYQLQISLLSIFFVWDCPSGLSL